MRSLIIALFLCLMFQMGGAQAQWTPLKPDSEKKSDATQSPEVIPLSSIATRTELDERRLQEIIQLSRSSSNTDALHAELKLTQENLARLEAQIQPENLDRLKLGGLLVLERHLNFLDRQLAQWQSRLQGKIRPVTLYATELAEKRKLWEDSYTTHEELLIPAIAESVQHLLRGFHDAEQSLSSPLSKLLELNHQASETHTRVSNLLATLNERIASYDHDLWHLDSPPLWQVWLNPHQKSNDHEALLRNLDSEKAFMQEFDLSQKGRNQLILLCSAFLLPAFWWIKRRADRVYALDKDLLRYRRTLSRPFSAWILVSLCIALLLQFHGPLLRLNTLLILAWLPAMRLQSRLISIRLGRWIYLSALFLLLHLTTQVLSSLPLFFRSLLFTSQLLLMLSSWFLFQGFWRDWQQDRRPFLRQGLIYTSAALALSTIALLANVFGNVSLSNLITDALIRSTYLGLFLCAMGNLVRALCRLLFFSTTEKIRTKTHHAGGLLDVSTRLFIFCLFLFWAYGTLVSFHLWRPLYAQWLAFSTVPFEIGSLTFTFGGVLLFLITVYVSFWLAKTLRNLLAEDVLGNVKLPRGVANSVATLCYYLVLMVGLMIALASIGFHLSQLALVIGALSVGIGFGLQTVVNNFVSGLILMIERPVQPGDTIELSNTVGKVREIGMRSTTLTTAEGADVVVPNGMLLSEKMINWTLNSEKCRIEIPIGVAYGSNPAQVLELLTQVTQETQGVSTTPPPSVLFLGFGNSSLDFSVRAWTSHFDESIFVRSRLALAIHDRLQQAGIEIPFPQQDLHLKSIDPSCLAEFQKHRS